MGVPVTRQACTTLWIAALAVAMAACGGSGSTPQTGGTSGGSTGAATAVTSGPAADVVALLPAAVKAKGQLNVGMEAQYPPFEFREPGSPTIVGADAELATRIGDLMGLKVSLSDAPFETLLPALPTGTYDVVMSALTSTTERVKAADFVTYYYEGDGLLVKGGNPKDLAVDATLCGVQVAVLKGSTQQSESVPLLDQGCTAARRPAVKEVEITGAGGLATALSSGRVDAVLTDRSNAAYTADKSSGALAFAPGQPFNPAPFGVATPKGNGMAKAVQKALERMIADGSYQQIVTKWGLQAGAVETPKINDVGD